MIGEGSLNVVWQIASGFHFAGKGLSPTAHCASPPGKLRAFVKFEFSCGELHTTVSHQPVLTAIYLIRAFGYGVYTENGRSVQPRPNLYGKRIRIGAARWGVDSFTQQRVLDLRKEIAALQRENELYKRNRSHTGSEYQTNELRRVRLQAIKEELLRLSGPSKRNRDAASPSNMTMRVQNKFWDEWGRKQ